MFGGPMKIRLATREGSECMLAVAIGNFNPLISPGVSQLFVF
jgi:hypothetical protein